MADEPHIPRSAQFILIQPSNFKGFFMREIYLERFFKKVRITPGCWIWTAGLRKGYGAFHVEDNKIVYAHRFSFEVHERQINDGEVICHSCDNPLCVNPSHLFPGSVLANMQDAKAKGRNAKGSRHGAAKLSEAEVVEIRRTYIKRHPDFSTVALARKYGVSDSQIWGIVNNKKW